MAEWMRFEWDPDKAASNLAKHGISFDTATFVFQDPNTIYSQDREVNGQSRWQALGRVSDRLLLLVAHTVEQRGATEKIRIISAREVNRAERQKYVRAIRY